MKKMVLCLLATMMMVSLTALVGCGGNGSNGESSGGGNGSEAASVSALEVDGFSFTLSDVDLNPMFGPGDLAEGHSPFSVTLLYTEDGDISVPLKKIYDEAHFLINGETVGVGTTASGADEKFITLLSGRDSSIADDDLSIELIYDNQSLKIK